jgi:hypothetical protein
MALGLETDELHVLEPQAAAPAKRLPAWCSACLDLNAKAKHVGLGTGDVNV